MVESNWPEVLVLDLDSFDKDYFEERLREYIEYAMPIVSVRYKKPIPSATLS